ncbi:NAD-dependent epimerase/dehydratase family protein [Escherichia coli]|nr:NAD-dependent epimerase/dehydratase family protein [Escherichia coli]
MLTSRANNWRKSPPTGAHSWRVKERDVPQRILVLGASGYIGQHLVRTLSQQGHQILAAARHVDRLAKLQLANVSCHKVRSQLAG